MPTCDFVKHCLVLISIILMCPLVTFGQIRRADNIPSPKSNKGEILKLTGHVLAQSSKTALEFATVSIYNQLDSSLIAGALTDAYGRFELSMVPGKHYAIIEYISYGRLIIDPVPQTNISSIRGQRIVDLGELLLEPNETLLNEVEIRAEKSESQFSLDKRVFNVGKDLANKGGTAEDILNNVPSVQVDIDGVVSLRGSEGVRMLIDGKPSGMLGTDNANGLRSIPSNMIEKVEVITNPSARNEAEGMSGIINIVLVKQKGSGFNGSFNASIGHPRRYGTGANLNYRKGNLNWFANYGLNFRKNIGKGMYYQSQQINNTLNLQNQTSDRDRRSLSNSIRLGIDYLPTSSQTLTGSFLYRKSDEDNIAELVYRDYLTELNNLVGTTFRTDDEIEDERNLEYSINYKKEFGKISHSLEILTQFVEKSETESSAFFETTTLTTADEVEDIVQRSANAESEQNWLLMIDYKRPLKGKDNIIELGLRSNLREITNDYLVEQLEDEQYRSLEGLTNNFEYNEDVHSAYVVYGRKIDRVGFQVGLRSEYSKVLTELVQSQEINDRDYFGLFPSMHISYELNEANTFQLSYSRRIRRPRFWDLNPFFTFSDSRNTFSGNPNLNPEYTDSYELSNIKHFDKGSFSASLFYRYTTDVIERILEFNDDGTTNRLPQNLSTRNDYGLEFTTQYTVKTWWRLNATFNFYRTKTNGQNLEESFNADSFTWQSNVTNKITFWNDSDLQIRFNYRGPRDISQGRRKSISVLDIGWSKDIFSNGTLTLSAKDVLNTRKRRSIIEDTGYFRESEFQWRGRSIVLSFNYRVNQKKKRGQGRAKSPNAGSEF